jgi:hypothetical protein
MVSKRDGKKVGSGSQSEFQTETLPRRLTHADGNGRMARCTQLRALHHRKVSGLFAFENPPGEDPGHAI